MEIGVHVLPVCLGSSVAVVPLFSWHDQFVDCKDPSGSMRSSGQLGVSNFFLALNRRALAYDYEGRRIVSITHFFPLLALEETEMPSHPIFNQIMRLNAEVNVFGYSPFCRACVDRVQKGIRFVRHAIEVDAQMGMPGPMEIWSGTFNTLKPYLFEHEQKIGGGTDWSKKVRQTGAKPTVVSFVVHCCGVLE